MLWRAGFLFEQAGKVARHSVAAVHSFEIGAVYVPSVSPAQVRDLVLSGGRFCAGCQRPGKNFSGAANLLGRRASSVQGGCPSPDP